MPQGTDSPTATSVEQPDLTAAAAAVESAGSVVEGAFKRLAADGDVDTDQVLAYDLAHAAAAVESARAVLEYGEKGDEEARIACAFVADAVHDVATRLMGREPEWGAGPGALDSALAFARPYRSPEFLSELCGILPCASCLPRAARGPHRSLDRHARLKLITGLGQLSRQKWLFVWSGVSPYLPEDAVAEVLAWVGAHRGSGTSIVFDAIWAEAIDGSREYFGAAELRRNATDLQEPLHWGIPEGQVEETLSPYGLQVERVIDKSAGRSIYLRRSDGSLHDRPYGFGVLIHARAAP